MIFKEFKAEDAPLFREYLMKNGENSCETAFVNLFSWQKRYGMSFALNNGIFFIKTVYNGEDLFYLPIGDTKKGMEALRQYSKKQYPPIWAQSGPLFENFKKLYGAYYNFVQSEDEADYIYLRENLANLSGKKYHSKRNHISAFSKKHEWQYEEITENNLNDVKTCAEKWYAENIGRMDREMQAEQAFIYDIFENMKTLSVFGGAIRADGIIVAFTLASAINGETADIHIEKSLADYPEGYAVINNEFAKRLTGFKYINREDDMGLDGLRRAKMSYHPNYLLKKYLCTESAEKRIYTEAFGRNGEFDDLLFESCAENIETLCENGETVSMLFLIPCAVSGKRVYYLYAAATAKEHRNKGFMTKLLKRVSAAFDAPIFLKPESEELVAFYEKNGFYKTFADRGADIIIEAGEKQKQLSALCDNCPDKFVIMFSDKSFCKDTYRFCETME